VKFNYEIDIV